MTIATRVQRVDHPARFSWIEASNQFRMVCEPDPHQLGQHHRAVGRWKAEASEDVKE